MNKRRWLMRVIARSLAYRRGRTLLLVCVLAMASSLLTALQIVSLAMEEKVAEEIRRYGANVVIVPREAALEVGSGGLGFGRISEPSYLPRGGIGQLLAAHSHEIVDYSLHLKGLVSSGGVEVAAEGVDFAAIRRLYPWWRIQGEWPGAGQILAGAGAARRLGLAPGSVVVLDGAGGVGVSGVVTTGAEEEELLFLDAALLSRIIGIEDALSEARLMVRSGEGAVSATARRLQGELPFAEVREVRQVAATSEGLLRRVQLLMALVTAVVVVASGASVAATMSATVMERRQEVGLLKAMGSTRGALIRQFALEALVIGVAGGAAGFVAGELIAALVVRTVFAASFPFLPLSSLLAIGSAVSLALLASLGALGSVYRLDPATSLRSE